MPQFLVVDKTRGCSQSAMGAGHGNLKGVDNDGKDSTARESSSGSTGCPVHYAKHPA